MRTTLNIDDELLMWAQNITNITSKPKLIREALKALVEREGARQLAKLGGQPTRAQVHSAVHNSKICSCGRKMEGS